MMEPTFARHQSHTADIVGPEGQLSSTGTAFLRHGLVTLGLPVAVSNGRVSRLLMTSRPQSRVMTRVPQSREVCEIVEAWPILISE